MLTIKIAVRYHLMNVAVTSLHKLDLHWDRFAGEKQLTLNGQASEREAMAEFEYPISRWATGEREAGSHIQLYEQRLCISRSIDVFNFFAFFHEKKQIRSVAQKLSRWKDVGVADHVSEFG